MLSELMQREVKDLSTHPHISNIETPSDGLLKLIYSPSETSSVYKDKSYRLEICLPDTYPEDPPAVRFADPIYHLNINYQSGQVRMAILEQDWSPFLSLTSVVESLDHILEQPEEGYPCSSDIFHQYENRRQTYLSKVLANIEYPVQEVLCRSNDAFFQFDTDRRDDAFMDSADDAKIENNKSSILVKQLRQSMLQVEDPPAMDRKPKRQNSTAVINKINTQQSIIIGNRNSQQKPQQKQHVIQRTSLQRVNSTSSKDSKGATLAQINATINIFIQEIEEIEKQLKSAKNPAVLKLLKERQDSQFEMMQEVMEMSEKIKKSMVRRLRQEISNI